MTVKLKYGFLPILLLFFASISAQTIDEQIYKADKQFDLQAFNLALQSYNNLAQQLPQHPHITMRVGDCLFQLNRIEESLAWYDRATSLPDVKKEALLSYGQALMLAGDYFQAKKWFSIYSQHDRNTADHYINACNYAMANVNKEPLYTVKLEGLNTASADFGASFYGDNIVYSSARSDMKRATKKNASTWTGQANNQLFIAKINSTTENLGQPTFLKSDLANNYNEGPVSYSENGTKVVFCQNNFVDGTRQLAAGNTNLSLYTADVVNGNWEEVHAFYYNGSDYGTGYPHLSPDGNTLYFASNRPNGFGGWDLYKSNWDGKKWSQPVNLGATVNSAGNEISPFVIEGILYFSSDYHAGFGGLDVFRSESENGTYSSIIHLGPGINSSYDDYGFIYNQNENKGYLTSNRAGGKGNEDIYSVTKKTDDFRILVTDLNKKPLANAIIDFTACGGGIQEVDAYGVYSFSVTYGKANCKAAVSMAGYESIEINVASSGGKTIMVELAPITVVSPPVAAVEAAPAPVTHSTPNPTYEAKNSAMVGQIFDKTTNAPVSEVAVMAVASPGGELLKSETDVNGFYTLPLEKSKSYRISYSKGGYSDSIHAISAKELETIKALPPMKLMDVAAVLAQKDVPSGGTSAPSPVTYNAPEEAPIAEEAPAQPTGYSIQCGALPRNASKQMMAKYNSLIKLGGNVYFKQKGKYKKVLFGVFPNEAAAKEKLSLVKKQGFKDAFVVEEKEAAEQFLIKSSEAEEPIAPVTYSAPTEVKAQPVEAPVAKTKGPVMYAVQVAALSKKGARLDLSPYSKLMDIANLYATNDDGPTKIRLGIWDNPEAASNAKEAIKKRGFTDAIVVTEAVGDPAKLIKAKKETVEKAVAPVTYSAPKVEIAPYKVRVASFRTINKFKDDVLEGLGGSIQKEKSGKTGKITVVYLTNFKNLEEAIIAKRGAVKRGFSDAYIVKKNEKGGYSPTDF